MLKFSYLTAVFSQKIVTYKRKGDVISVPSSQEILPEIFSNETAVLSCTIFVLKTI